MESIIRVEGKLQSPITFRLRLMTSAFDKKMEVGVFVRVTIWLASFLIVANIGWCTPRMM